MVGLARLPAECRAWVAFEVNTTAAMAEISAWKQIPGSDCPCRSKRVYRSLLKGTPSRAALPNPRPKKGAIITKGHVHQVQKIQAKAPAQHRLQAKNPLQPSQYHPPGCQKGASSQQHNTASVPATSRSCSRTWTEQPKERSP